MMNNTFSKKVVDPHTNMPEEVKEAFFNVGREWDLSNNSFTFWAVGKYDYSHQEDADAKIVDDWVKENFLNEEEIVILYWW